MKTIPYTLAEVYPISIHYSHNDSEIYFLCLGDTEVLFTLELKSIPMTIWTAGTIREQYLRGLNIFDLSGVRIYNYTVSYLEEYVQDIRQNEKYIKACISDMKEKYAS